MEEIVTVVIPSYNRAHLLERTIPTYLQEGVKEIILVDDCSPDNTEDVVKKLQEQIPQLKYFKLPYNMKQQAAKNRGVEEVNTPWIYFGDDDSMLYPGSIKRLYDTCLEYNVEACGAIAYYMKTGEENLSLDEYIEKNCKYAECLDDIVDIKRMYANFSYSYRTPIIVPFCQACILLKTDIAKKVKFDPLYLGNAYREETDFIIRCIETGATFMYDSRAAQINLPANMSTGGARGKSVWKYKKDMIVNNWRFLKKNHAFMKKKWNLPHSKYRMQWDFTIAFLTRPVKRLLKKICHNEAIIHRTSH